MDKREQDGGHLSKGEPTLSCTEHRLKGAERPERKREPLSLLFTSAALSFHPRISKRARTPGTAPCFLGSIFPSPTTDMKSSGLPARGRGLRACWRGVCECVQVFVLFFCFFCVVVGCRGHQASSSQGPADTNTGIQEQLDPSSLFPSLHLLLLPLHWELRNAGWTFFFLQEMKRSSVQRSSEGLAPPLLPFPLRDGGERRGRSRTSSRPAFEVWEVKITGTALRLNRRFHLPGQIKAPAAGARLPYSPLTPKPTDPPPPQLPLSLPAHSSGVSFGAINKENTTDKLH